MSRHISARPEQTSPSNLSALQPGDRVRSVYSRRLGTVVKVYADGSAAVRWDDGDPQPEGLAHERMPRALLDVVPASSANQRTEVGSRR